MGDTSYSSGFSNYSGGQTNDAGVASGFADLQNLLGLNQFKIGTAGQDSGGRAWGAVANVLSLNAGDMYSAGKNFANSAMSLNLANRALTKAGQGTFGKDYWSNISNAMDKLSAAQSNFAKAGANLRDVGVNMGIGVAGAALSTSNNKAVAGLGNGISNYGQKAYNAVKAFNTASKAGDAVSKGLAVSDLGTVGIGLAGSVVDNMVRSDYGTYGNMASSLSDTIGGIASTNPWSAAAYWGTKITNDALNTSIGASNYDAGDLILNNVLGFSLWNNLKGKLLGLLDYDALTHSALDSGYAQSAELTKWGAKHSGLKVGGLLHNADSKLNKMNNAITQELKMEDIYNKNLVAQIGAGNPYIGFGVQMADSGGYLQRGTYMGKNGLKFAKRVTSTYKMNKFASGGKTKDDDRDKDKPKLEPDEKAFKALSEEEKAKLLELINSSDANFVQRLKDPNGTFIDLGDGTIGTHKLSWSEDENGTMIYPEIQEINGQLVDLSKDRNAAWRSAVANRDYIYVPSNDAAEWFTKNYKLYYPRFKYTPQKYELGGSFNVIPDGALHKNKHHLEDVDEKFEDVTTKGIPVITEDKDGEITQHAEVEINEIIFRLEVTLKLEKLMKEDNDDAAIEAGKILVKEILENTHDNTGLIELV